MVDITEPGEFEMQTMLVPDQRLIPLNGVEKRASYLWPLRSLQRCRHSQLRASMISLLDRSCSLSTWSKGSTTSITSVHSEAFA